MRTATNRKLLLVDNATYCAGGTSSVYPFTVAGDCTQIVFGAGNEWDRKAVINSDPINAGGASKQEQFVRRATDKNSSVWTTVYRNAYYAITPGALSCTYLLHHHPLSNVHDVFDAYFFHS